MKVRSAAALVVVWALTVVSVAFVTWQVIHTAGRDVLDESAGPALTRSTGPTPTPFVGSEWDPSTPPAHGPGDSSPAATPDPAIASPSAGAPASAPSSATSAPTHIEPTHATTHPGSPGSGHDGHHETSTPAPTPVPAVPSVDSWRGEAGVVTVSCDPDRVSLLGATPADGYRVEVEQEENVVQAQFKREEPEDEVQVVARCLDGSPRFEVEQDELPHEDRPPAPLTS